MLSAGARSDRERLLRKSALALLLVCLLSCGNSRQECVPGQSAACAGTHCTGHQTCSSDGASYGRCICDGGEDLQFPATGPYSGLIGASCTDATGCRIGLECVDANSRLLEGEGPSAGMCLARCQPNQDQCRGLDARSKCTVLDDGGSPSDPSDDTAYCLPGCAIGIQLTEPDKCRGRADLVCSETVLGSGIGLCIPACRGDVDCDGRFCDLGTGKCGDRAAEGAPIGAACDDEASVRCAGACLVDQAGYSACSGVCSYGTAGCGQGDFEPPLEYFCAQGAANGSGAGDLGYCVKLCDCDQDCNRTDMICESRAELKLETGRQGICASKMLADGTPRKATPC